MKRGINLFIQKNQFIKAGVTFSAGALLFFANQTEASANEYTSANWEPRTVSEIEAQISEQRSNQDHDKDVVKYSFVWGDTLWGVSQATDISVDKLVQVNDIDNRSMIHVGSTIYLSKDSSVISVQNGDEEVVSYDVSNGDAVETETPEEVEESSQEEVVEETAQVEETQEEEAVEETVQEAEVEETESVEVTVVEEVAETEAQEEVVEETVVEEAVEPAAPAASNAQSSENGYTMTVEATAYSRNQPVLSNHTFTGIDLRENPRVIAVDPNVIPLGSTIVVPGYGEYVAGDTGGAIIGNRIDVHIESLQEAIQFGRRTIDIQVFE
ncbi:MAG: LysM peptidoglycan-binding domain-containing protein [Alkalibacterium sp.]|nr:LysM peptidoglycan-binding domain-containing protein [Alkalibacterium sp.]